ncbi:hypothetical protein CPT_Sansa42 [Caulobacter phage Sansa]|uniref:Uncharacterized protein n=1 Tax=Caulobacter phage Sansa TaxID=1675600 RepID=A0A0K1LLS4_9CAUD|nr:hypothetical protein HOR07_gp042 [Caulobacter phage Sansa]AKU43446.1 hypothetical protein CPT_Sansa42 [Caulobacter phage Sansa]
MITALIYEPKPDDPKSGRIIQTVQAYDMSAEPRPWVPAPDNEYRIDWDRTHKIVNEEVLPIEE